MGRAGMTTGRLNVGGIGASTRAGAATDSALSPENPALKALRTVIADKRVRTVETAVCEACPGLRRNGVLRRRWREARAEVTVRGATALGDVEGTVVSAEVLRK